MSRHVIICFYLLFSLTIASLILNKVNNQTAGKPCCFPDQFQFTDNIWSSTSGTGVVFIAIDFKAQKQFSNFTLTNGSDPTLLIYGEILDIPNVSNKNIFYFNFRFFRSFQIN